MREHACSPGCRATECVDAEKAKRAALVDRLMSTVRWALRANKPLEADAAARVELVLVEIESLAKGDA